MKYKLIAFTGFTTLIVTIFACSSEDVKSESEKDETHELVFDEKELVETAQAVFGKLPSDAPTKHYEITEEKVRLGKVLYFDKRLSKNNTISCNSCHQLDNFGVDSRATSEGDGGEFGDRNSPTTFNAALHFAQFWDGRAKDVEEQAGMPILNPIEHGIPDEKFIINRLSKIELYQQLFAEAFPEDKKPISYQNLTYAIGAFERTLLTPSRYDDYIAGNYDALTTLEKTGLHNFIESGCTACHSGSLFGGRMYNKFGVFGDYWEMTESKIIDKGRFEITNDENDLYSFKVPSLRNITKTSPYFHDGSVEDLEKAVTIMAKLQSNKELKEDELKSILAFLDALTGDISEETKTPPSELDKEFLD